MVGLRLIPPIGAPIVVSQDVSVVGREPGCEIYVNDGSVSRRHARVERRGAAFFVVDEGSANGTFLDSQRVADALLRPGQELRFGAVPFRVEITGTQGFESDGTILGGTPMAAPPVPRPAAPPGYAPPPPAPAYPPPPPAAVPPPAYPSAPRPPAYTPGAPPPPPPPPGHAPSVRPPRPVGPAEGPPVAAPRQGKSVWFWVGIGCGGLLLIGLLIAGGIGLVIYKGVRAFQAPVEAVQAQLADVKAGNLDAAYARLTPEYQADVTKEEFQAFAAKHGSFAQNADTTFNNRSMQSSTATLGGSLRSVSGDSESATFRLVEQGGAWRISDIEVGGERPQNAIPDTGSGVMTVEVTPSGVQKRLDGGTLRITIRIQVTGFKVRPENGVYAIDLAEDVETTGPDGVVIEGLSRPDVERFAGNTSLPTGAFANFTTNLTMDPNSVPGTYTVKLTVRDLVGGGRVEHSESIQVP
jgi:hypothetical protein